MYSGRGRCEKLTKINILHVTINYIRAMENLLSTGDSGVRSYSEMVRNPIRPNEKRNNKFELLEEEEEELRLDQDGRLVPQERPQPQQQRKAVAKKKAKKSGKKAAAKGQPLRDVGTQPQQLRQQQQIKKPSLFEAPRPPPLQQGSFPPVPLAKQSPSGSFFGSPFYSIKSCLETSSDSGISSSSSSSSSVSPTAFATTADKQVAKTKPAAQPMLDPLLGSSFVQRQQKLKSSSTSSFSSASLSSMFEDVADTDEMLREVVGLVDSLHDDFPAIAFEEEEDPFGEWMLPKAM